MAGTTYKGGTEARERLVKDVGQSLRTALVNAQVRVHGRYRDLAPAATPVASGELNRSWRNEPADPRSAAEAMRLSKFVNTAAHGGIVNAGLHRNKRAYWVRPAGRKPFQVAAGARSIGSRKAQLGISGPVMRTVEGEVEGILDQEVAREEGGGE